MWKEWEKDMQTSPILVDGKRMCGHVYGTKGGGMTDDCGVLYLEQILSKCVPRTKEKPGVIVCDGHGSHLTLALLEMAAKLNFVIVLRPPHTASRLQGGDPEFCFGTSQSTSRSEKEHLLAQGTALGMGKVPANPKSAVQAAVRPVAAQWAASVPTTRAQRPITRSQSE